MKVELIGIHKSFGPVHANDDIHLLIPAGTIQGILGENGAGKSTLMKVLSGFIQADSGQILLNDIPVEIHSPSDAIKHGIGMLHQDPLDFPPMTVLDNFLIGSNSDGKAALFPNRSKLRKELNTLQREFDFAIDPDDYVETLTVGERQQLEILRLLWLGVQVLILDEPTTGISALQKEKLFEAIRKLAQEGKTIIFVSHKLEDVEDLCHCIAVLRQGKLVGEAKPPYLTDELVKMMFGRLVTLAERHPAEPGEPVLELVDVAVEDHRIRIDDVNLEACSGETIGLAGMEGSGQRLLLQACAGILRPVAGRVLVDGEDMTGRNFHSFLQRGVAYLPASRLEEGLIPGLSLTEHFALARTQEGMFVDRQKATKSAAESIDTFSIRGEPHSYVEALSGGNQQRALLSLLRSPLRLLLMEHPTRGLDVESAIYIWRKLKERGKAGTSIVFISSDLDEILDYSDRVLVFFAGHVSPPIDASTTTVEELGQLIGGKGW